MDGDIRAIRAALRLSQDQMAAYFGVRPRQVRRWETGQPMGWRTQECLTALLENPRVRPLLEGAGVRTTGESEERDDAGH